MHLPLLLTLTMGFMALLAAQPHCDPLTQYESFGQCCQMCGPGTRVSSSSTCLDPQCTECAENEYQEKYTSEVKCPRQPYCDPNKNFQVVVQKSKKKESPCVCKDGFHCSSEECITCVPHAACSPGSGAQPQGNHTHDTTCRKCPERTFSNEKSWKSVCKKWTECADGFHIQQTGTGVSDNICEETPRSHAVVMAVVCSLIGVLLVVVVTVCLCKGKANGNVKVCVESCLGEKRELLRETKVLIITPTDATKEVEEEEEEEEEEESMMPEQLSSQEQGGGAGPPEENEDQPSEEVPARVRCLSENGNFVTEEYGKSLILPRQESQTQTFTD